MNLNQSRLRTYQDCQRRYYHQFIAGIELRRVQSGLYIGHGVHKFLEAWYRTGKSDEALASMKEDFAKQKEDMPLLPEEEVRVKNDEQKAEQLAKGYIETWPSEPFRVIAPEVQGDVPLNERHRLFFQADAIIEWQKRLWLLEHKTAARTGASYFAKFYVDMQLTAYIWGATQVLKQPITGALLNVMVKTSVPKFEREWYTRTDEELRRFVRTAVALADEIEHKLGVLVTDNDDPALDTLFPMNTSACVRFGVCPYLDICRFGPRPDIMGQYSERKRDYTEPENDEE